MSTVSHQSSPEPNPQCWASQGLTLNYFEWGSPEKPLLILIHGNGDHARSWDAIAKVLSRNWYVITPDLRGHGDSQWSPDGAYFTSYFVMDIVDLIDSLAVKQVSIIGHSFGGVIGLRYAAMYPDSVKQLVVIDGYGPSEEVKKSWSETGATARTREWIKKRRNLRSQSQRYLNSIDEAADRLTKNNPRLTEKLAKRLAQHGTRRAEGGLVWKRDPLIHAFTPEDFAQETASAWRHISAPTLFLYGKESWKYHPDVQTLEHYFANARGEVIENAGHWLHHDQFDRFIASLQGFLVQ